MMELEFLNDIIHNRLDYKSISKNDENYEYYLKNKNDLEQNNIKPYFVDEVVNIIKQAKNKNIFIETIKDFDITKLYKSKKHGLNHNIRVLIFSFLISEIEQLEERDIKIIFEASKYHDIGRINDSKDDDHGKRSADLLSISKKMYSKEEINLLKTIIECHSIDDNNLINIGNKYSIKNIKRCQKLLNVLKDADALDRVRLNYPYIKLDLLRTDASKKLVLFAYDLYFSYSSFILNESNKLKTSSYFT